MTFNELEATLKQILDEIFKQLAELHEKMDKIARKLECCNLQFLRNLADRRSTALENHRLQFYRDHPVMHSSDDLTLSSDEDEIDGESFNNGEFQKPC